MIGTVIKVRGTMSARLLAGQAGTVLVIDVNYRFVYAVEPPRAPADWMRVVGQLTGYIEFGDSLDLGGPIQPWDVAFPSEAGVRCGMTDGYLHPGYPGGPPGKVQPSGAPLNPYSMSKPGTIAACRAISGT